MNVSSHSSAPFRAPCWAPLSTERGARSSAAVTIRDTSTAHLPAPQTPPGKHQEQGDWTPTCGKRTLCCHRTKRDGREPDHRQDPAWGLLWGWAASAWRAVQQALAGGSAGRSVALTRQGGWFDPRSGCVQEPTNECIEKWDNKSTFLSHTHKSIDKTLKIK